jgi:hypothetical protein
MDKIAKTFGFRDSDLKSMPKYDDKDAKIGGSDKAAIEGEVKEIPTKDATKLKEEL